MTETAKLLEPGFSVADAEYPEVELRAGVLALEFVDWREVLVRVRFLDVAGIRWQEVDSKGPEDRDDSVFEIVGSRWIAEYQAAGVTSPAEGLRHYRLCFNACGVLDVLASTFELVDAAEQRNAADSR